MINMALIKLLVKEGGYILAVVLIPLIILGFCILRKGKYKKATITIISILIVFVYAISAKSLVESASKIVAVCTIKSVDESVGTDITFLKNYEQKMARDGYISKYDATQILDIADSKSKEILINYKDTSSNIDISTTNKNDEEMKNLKDMLETNYYIFNYSTDGNIIINIERYVSKETKSNEKNDSIIITGDKIVDIIECVDRHYTSDESTYFSFKNKVNVDAQNTNVFIQTFKILLVYDEDMKNYVPVVQDTQDYEYIESYTVYSGGIKIELKNGAHLDNKDYTLRINRYGDDLTVLERQNSNINTRYYYEYEPVVTETTNSNGNVVLNVEFDTAYSVNGLKNVEVIFGK